MKYKIYSEFAAWWPLLSAPKEYADEADFFVKLFQKAGLPKSPSLLELGSGGGNNALHMKKAFASVTLTDLSAEMLAVSRQLNPDCKHFEGDMRSVRLGETFDTVFVHDAIDYMTTPRDLAKMIETIAVHCKPGGAAMLAPDFVEETFKPETSHGGHDGDGRAMRYLEWTYDPDPDDTMYTTDFAIILREDGRPLRTEHERHIFGLFPRDIWTRLLQNAGFEVEIVRDNYERDLFLARK